jgi:hypothetical protein
MSYSTIEGMIRQSTNNKIMNTQEMTDTTYNGWTNYETWNVALWIGNDEGIYNFAKGCETYQDFVFQMRDCFESTETPDGVAWNDSGLDHSELDEVLKELT